ncbi:MAG: asparagine synthase (glutamine-hydrolyzing) [Candidatus Altiarchaeota archaeon]
MCGIVGIMGFEDRGLLRDMMDTVHHRGPDDCGEYHDSDVMLGHLRLSIIDLSTGKQPIFNEEGDVVTIYNGEIYNYLELRRELEAEGHKFRTNTDTEVIVHLYEEHGPLFVEHLRGMFAIALWDASKKRLVLARDRLGIKPVYYFEKDGAFLFASEVKALLEYDGLNPALNKKAIHYYLTLQYVPGMQTALEGVMKLQPGHMLVREGGKTNVTQYWDLKAQLHDVSESQCLKELDALLSDCVRMRLMSDVSLGAYLSGGLDSSTMVDMMTSMMPEPVKTFSVGFGYEDVDEVKYAKTVADHYRTDHHEIIIDSHHALKSLPLVIWHLDEPIGDPAAVPTYFLSERAKRKVTVVLTGEGGDEAFAGYRTYKLLNVGDRMRNILPPVMKDNVIPYAIKNIPGFTRGKRYLRYISAADEEKVYLGQGHVLDEEERGEYYTGEFQKANASVDSLSTVRQCFRARNMPTFLSRLQYVDLKTWVPEDLLMKLDKTSMAWAIEGRVPLLDHKLLEYTMSLPAHMKLRGSTDKYILKRLMRDRLPKEILARKKQGFRVPMHHWMLNELREFAHDILSKENVRRRGILRPDKVQALLGKPKNLWRGHQIWALITLELWQRMYIDGMPPGSL